MFWKYSSYYAIAAMGAQFHEPFYVDIDSMLLKYSGINGHVIISFMYVTI